VDVDVEFFEEHYSPDHPDLTDNMWEVVDHLRAKCPVAHSDAPMDLSNTRNGFYVLTRYQDVARVLQDWQTFSSNFASVTEVDEDNPVAAVGQMPPITTDPPLQRDFRRLMNPFLSPQAVAGHEPQIREIVTELIDDFIEDGQCDIVGQLARLHPPRMLYRILFGIDDEAELQRNLDYMKRMANGSAIGSDLEAMMGWISWVSEFVAERRSAPRRPDIIDALLHGSVDGRPLTDEEIGGTIRILILGGFSTTTDATSATMLKLVEYPDLQARLRDDFSLIPGIFDEMLRVESPVISLPRTCTRDVELGGIQLERGDTVLMHFGGANRDPSEFDRPGEVDVDRARNRHLAFGGGPHRCIGSNVARLNLRVVFEEILTRLHDIRITPGDAPRQSPAGLGWGLEYLPISFTPGPRLLP